MPHKNRVEYNAYSNAWIKRNRARQNGYRAALRAGHRAWIDSHKDKCRVCGENNLVCLDFHHRDPKDKLFDIGAAATRGYGREKLATEIEKCDVLCANCHRKSHRG